MALESAFLDLRLSLRQFIDVVSDLVIALTEDHPADPTQAVQSWADCALNLQGIAQQSGSDSARCLRMLGPTPDFYQLRHCLSSCQALHNRAVLLWLNDFGSMQRLEALIALKQRPQREWQAWVASVDTALQCCLEPMGKVAITLATCWQELSERAGGLSVTVHSASVGQMNGMAKSSGQVSDEVSQHEQD
jgi:hypothetical protein